MHVLLNGEINKRLKEKFVVVVIVQEQGLEKQTHVICGNNLRLTFYNTINKL